MPVSQAEGAAALQISVCVGTSCFIRGSQALLQKIVEYLIDNGLSHMVSVDATFCTENCDRGPTVCVGDQMIFKATIEDVVKAMNEKLAGVKV
jgi:NADH-quinone oxidoreductase subunit G